jgi:hypothetical protein
MAVVRRFLAKLVLGAAAFGSPVLAKPPAPPPPAPAKPPVDVRVSVLQTGPDEKWELKIENASSTPARVGIDMRFLWFEVTKPGQAKPKVCRLPADMVPADVPSHNERELAGGDSTVRKFDPRFYCFSAAKQEILVPSAQVTPHYGFPHKTKARWAKGKRVEEKVDDAPYIAEPIDAEGIGPRKELIGNPVILDPRYAAWSGTPGEEPNPDGEDEPDEPELRMLRGSDAKTEMNVTAVVRVRNPTRQKLLIFLRRELLTFQVLTPQGVVPCEAEPDERNPDRRAFRSVAPGGSVTLVSRLVELCERGTFAEPALYLVKAELRVPADGGEFGLDAFTGTLKTPVPATVRVRKPVEIVRNMPSRAGATGGVMPPPPGAPPQMQNPGMQIPAPAPAPPPPPPPPPAQ